ncbi:MAG: hypothetical protein WBP26_02115 [Candidatus Saccharimonadales bacterium]
MTAYDWDAWRNRQEFDKITAQFDIPDLEFAALDGVRLDGLDSQLTNILESTAPIKDDGFALGMEAAFRRADAPVESLPDDADHVVTVQKILRMVDRELYPHSIKPLDVVHTTDLLKLMGLDDYENDNRTIRDVHIGRHLGYAVDYGHPTASYMHSSFVVHDYAMKHLTTQEAWTRLRQNAHDEVFADRRLADAVSFCVSLVCESEPSTDATTVTTSACITLQNINLWRVGQLETSLGVTDSQATVGIFDDTNDITPFLRRHRYDGS